MPLLMWGAASLGRVSVIEMPRQCGKRLMTIGTGLGDVEQTINAVLSKLPSVNLQTRVGQFSPKALHCALTHARRRGNPAPSGAGDGGGGGGSDTSARASARRVGQAPPGSSPGASTQQCMK